MRLKKEQLQLVKNKLGVKTLYSYSKVSTFEQCLNLYMMKYVEYKRGLNGSCYTYFGTLAHEIIQDYYEGKYKNRNEMLEAFNDGVAEWTALIANPDNKHFKFTSDSERDKYILNLQHYFSTVELLQEDIKNERLILTEFMGNEKYAFQGYIDSMYQRKSDGKTVIMDYKTSSISGFSGAKLNEKSKQLFIYAIGLTQRFGVKVEDIVLVYDMMKYMNVTYIQKNGTPKITHCERSSWVGKMSSPIRKKFKEYNDKFGLLQKEVDKKTKYMSAKCRTEEEVKQAEEDIKVIYSEMEGLGEPFSEDEINEYIETAMLVNSIEGLPEVIRNEFTFGNCFIEVEFNEDTLKEMEAHIVEVLDEIVVRTSTGDFERGRIMDNESFYCTNLCDLRSECNLYKEYREDKGMFVGEQMTDDDILNALGL